MSTKPSALRRLVDGFAMAPAAVRPRLITAAVRQVVPFVGTARIRVEELTPERAVLLLPNRRRVQNHIQGVHAAATGLLAETATGFVLGMNLPADALPLLKSMHVDYQRLAKGSLRAVATLTEVQRQQAASEPKGAVDVAIVVTDEEGNQPVAAQFVWAWRPAKR